MNPRSQTLPLALDLETMLAFSEGTKRVVQRWEEAKFGDSEDGIFVSHRF